MIQKSVLKKIQEVLSTTPCHKAYVFGSYANGTADKYSDLDLVIIADTDRPFVERFRDYYKILEISPVPVELFIYTPDEFERMIEQKNPLITNVLQEGKCIYEKCAA